MSDEKECLECNLRLPVSNLFRGTKTNAYGDKVKYGYICRNCYRIGIKKRSSILLGFSIGLLVFAFIAFGLGIYIYLFVKDLLAEQFFTTIETFNLLGIFLIIFSIIIFYIRSRELNKMRKKLRKKGT